MANLLAVLIPPLAAIGSLMLFFKWVNNGLRSIVPPRLRRRPAAWRG